MNLPAVDKMAEPHFSMLWDSDTPRVRHTDAEDLLSEVIVIAGTLAGQVPPSPPPSRRHPRAAVRLTRPRDDCHGLTGFPSYASGNASKGTNRHQGGDMAELDRTVWTAPVRNLTWVAARFGHR